MGTQRPWIRKLKCALSPAISQTLLHLGHLAAPGLDHEARHDAAAGAGIACKTRLDTHDSSKTGSPCGITGIDSRIFPQNPFYSTCLFMSESMQAWQDAFSVDKINLILNGLFFYP